MEGFLVVVEFVCGDMEGLLKEGVVGSEREEEEEHRVCGELRWGVIVHTKNSGEKGLFVFMVKG